MGRYAYGRWGLGFLVGWFGVLAAAMVIWAATLLVERPREYRALADHGVLAFATARCGDDSCKLTYIYASRRRTNTYYTDVRQFCRCPVPAPVLVDPEEPATMYTVRDVRRRTDAGLGVGSVFAIVMALLFAGAAAGNSITLRKTPSEPPEPPLLRPDASPLVRALRALQVLKLQLDLASLRGGRRHRVDADRLAAVAEELRRHVAGIPGPTAEARHAADRIVAEIRDAPRIPVIGGAASRPPSSPSSSISCGSR